MSEDPPQFTRDDIARFTRDAIDRERKQRRANAIERARLIAKVNRGGVKHPAGATKSTPARSARRAKAKAGRKTARRTR